MHMQGFPRAGWTALAACLLFTLGTTPASADEGAPSDRELPETPAEYEASALEQNTKLRALYERWQATRKKADAAGSRWPQPKVGYQTFIDGWWLDNASLTHMGSVSQKFPWPGVLDKSAEPVRQRAGAIRHRFRARTLEIVFEVRRHLIDVARIDALRDILREQRTVYEDVAEIVESSMESDQADYGDLLRVSTAREKLSDRLDNLASKREQRLADLRDALDLPPETELTFDFDEGRNPLEVPETRPDRAELIETARREHPDLAAARAEADARIAEAEYARAKRLPWPSAGIGVRSMPDHMGASGANRWTALMLSVSVPIPLFVNQYDLERQQRLHQREGVRASREGTELKLAARVDAASTRIDEKLRRLKRYREELLPLAGEATEHMLQQIETGERSVTDYLLSFEQELDLETNVVEFRAAVAIERARLQKLTGGAFDAYPATETPTTEIRDLAETGENRE